MSGTTSSASDSRKPYQLLLQCTPRSNLREWTAHMELLTRESLGDISQVLMTDEAIVPTPPTQPVRPVRMEPVNEDAVAEAALAAAHQLNVDTFDMTLKPLYKAELGRYGTLTVKLQEDNRKLYAMLMLHLSADSKSRIEASAADYAEARLTSDGLALFRLIKRTHVFSAGDRWTQVQTQLQTLDDMQQKGLPFEKYLALYTVELKYLEELAHPMTDADKISKFLRSVNKQIFQKWIMDQSVAGTLPDTFVALTAAMLKYDITTKSIIGLYGSGKATPHHGAQVSNIAEEDEENVELDTDDEANYADAKDTPKVDTPSKHKPAAKKKASTPIKGDKPAKGADNKGEKPKVEVCNYCKLRGLKGVGHTMKTCRALKAELGSEVNTSELALAISLMEVDDRTLILDNGATVSVIKNADLLRNIRLLPKPVTIRGISSLPVQATHEGDLPKFGKALYVPSASRNLLAWSSVKDKVAWQPVANQFVVEHSPSRKIANLNADKTDWVWTKHPAITSIFTATCNGLYAHRIPGETTTKTPPATDQGEALPAESEDDPALPVLHPREPATAIVKQRYLAAIRLHDALDHPGDAALAKALDGGAYLNCTVTSRDLRDARKHYCPCIRSPIDSYHLAPTPVHRTHYTYGYHLRA